MQELKTKKGIMLRYTVDNGNTIFIVQDISEYLGYKDNMSFVNLINPSDIKYITLRTKGVTRSMLSIDKEKIINTIQRSRSLYVKDLCEELGLELKVVKILAKETGTILFIIKCFMGKLKMTREFTVGKYRVDLYIHDLNIVVECDENDHSRYPKDKELERTTEISRILNNPVWIRFNPDTSDMSDTVNRIVQFL